MLLSLPMGSSVCSPTDEPVIIVDGILDSGIAQFVKTLQEHGIETFESCEPVEIQEVSSFAHLLTFLTRTQVLRKGCFTPSRVSTMIPISFHPLPLQ